MIKKSKYRILIPVILCSIIWAACTQQRQPCLTPKIATLNMHCLHKAADTATVFADTALPNTLFAAYSDSGTQYLIYRGQASDFTISLSSAADSCKWGITTDTTRNSGFDTLTFFYKRKLQFISNACGYAYFYNLDSVHTTGKTIDSVRILNANVNNNVKTKHLQIYIHPDF